MAVRACYGATRRRLRSAGCLGGELEAMRSEGFGFDQALPAATTLGFGVIAGVSWAYPVAGPVAVRLDITSAFLVARPVLTEARTGQILYDPNFLSWRGLAGAEVTFR